MLWGPGAAQLEADWAILDGVHGSGALLLGASGRVSAAAVKSAEAQRRPLSASSVAIRRCVRDASQRESLAAGRTPVVNHPCLGPMV